LKGIRWFPSLHGIRIYSQQLKKIKYLPLVTFFILPPNIQALKNRLSNRHKGQEE